MYAVALGPRCGERARRLPPAPRVAAASLAARDVERARRVADARLRVLQLGEHLVVDRGHVLEAVELAERVVERPCAEDDLERARVAVVEQQPDARGEPLLRDAGAAERHLHLGCEHDLLSAQRRRPGAGAARAGRAPARGSSRGRRGSARPSARATRARRSRLSGRSLDGPDRDGSAPPTAGRMRKQEAAMAMPNARRRGACACPSTGGTLPGSRRKNREKQPTSCVGSTRSLPSPAVGSRLNLSEHLANLPDS